jgi:hypothetical protein
MRTGLQGVVRVHLPRPRRWLRHLLLAVSLVAVVLSIVGMHQLSVGHDVATGPTASSAHAETVHSAGSGERPPTAMAEHPGDHLTQGMPTGVPGGACPHPAGAELAARPAAGLSRLAVPAPPAGSSGGRADRGQAGSFAVAGGALRTAHLIDLCR